uniref:DNA mismatch repair proteins mutS family domain-containing protein n=1 Tax=viral metagenome TaxID=1070528 RepID=A0A6C0LD86_9ZZZZ
MTIIDEYLSLTKKYKHEYSEKTLLLMQVGSFFECYALLDPRENTYQGSNIQEFSDINDLVISKKNVLHNGTPVAMAGFGITQLEKYVRRMQENDYTVVVHTQDSNTKNTTRSLSCIYSPGTYFSNDSNELSNVTSCIWIHYSASNKLINEKLTIGMSSIDIYTGNSNTMEYIVDYIKSPTVLDSLENYLCINNPSECIVVSNYKLDYVLELINCKVHTYNYDHEWIKNVSKQKYQYEIIKTFLNKDPDTIFNEWNISTQSYCLLSQFIYKHNPNLIKKLQVPSLINTETKLILANHSLKQLNIIPDNNHTGKYSCISTLLNNCITSMGKRAFNYELLNPSIDYKYLNEIYDITSHTIDKNMWQVIRNYLNGIKDLSKIYRKIILGKLSPKDFYIIYNNLTTVNNIFLHVSKDTTLLNYINTENVSFCITQIQEYISKYLNLESCKKYDDLSFDKFNLNCIHDIMLFNDNFSDDLNNTYNTFKNYYTKLIQIKDFLDLSIKDYESKNNSSGTLNKKNENSDYVKLHECPKTEPTLVGTTRRLNTLKKIIHDLTCDHFNPKSIEIKSHNGSNSMITSNEINTITKNIIKYKEMFFDSITKEFSNFANNFIQQFEIQINTVIYYITKCDILQNRCYVAETFSYTKPTILDTEKSFVDFKGLRHPLIEKINTNEIYVTNDLNFDLENNSYLLYGTNAVGKTSFIKSIGISIIMAQAGLYVPADSFTFSTYKSIYTRILGNDNLFKGLSTFAVEMTELRSILKNANENSIILGDELCSGTESTSALSIFTAGIKYLSLKNCCFIFATHFHEIINYSEIKELDTLKLLHMSVIYDRVNDRLIYDRKLKEGPGDNMYGLEVCKSLNLPEDFLEMAHDIRNKYNNKSNTFNQNGLIIEKKTSQYNNSKIKGVCEICKESEGTEVHHLIYQKEFENGNSKGNKLKKNHKANLINICEKCHDKIHEENSQLKIYKTTNGYEIL